MSLDNINLGNYVPAGCHRFGDDGGMTAAGEIIPPSAMKEILALRAELAKVLIDKPIPLRMARVKGQTIEEMRDNFYQTDLYQMGDACLYWINEGDLTMLTIFGNVVYCDITDTKP